MTPRQIREKIQLASAETVAKSANIHVCSRQENILGSGKGECTLCHHAVYYSDLKQANLPKVCLECAMKLPEFNHAQFLACRNSPWDQYQDN